MALFTDIFLQEYFDQFSKTDNPYQLIDVRETDEYLAGHLPSAIHIPLGDVLARTDEISKDIPVVLVCAMGGRSALAAEQLAAVGYTNLYNLQGGTMGYINAGHTVEK